MSNEYAVTEDDLKGGGGSNDKAKPRGKYTGVIEKAQSKTDKNGKVYLAFQVRINHGKTKNQIIFENYLTLDPKANAFHKARRNSFYQAIGLKAGSIPYGVPGGPSVELLNGTIVDVNLEHRFEQVPGEDYNIVTSKSSKSPWVTNGWAKGLDEEGNLVRSPGGTVYDAPVKPREETTFYALSDEFEGVGPAQDDAPVDEPVADEDDWG